MRVVIFSFTILIISIVFLVSRFINPRKQQPSTVCVDSVKHYTNTISIDSVVIDSTHERLARTINYYIAYHQYYSKAVGETIEGLKCELAYERTGKDGNRINGNRHYALAADYAKICNRYSGSLQMMKRL
jgi:hypothetical protein